MALLIAIVIGFSAQQTFTQKTSKIGKKGKMIELPKPPPKQLFVEVKVKGSGTYRCQRPGMTCTWKIDRTYSARIDLTESEKVPFDQMMSEPGTALAIAQAKVAAKAKTKPANAFNTRWSKTFTDPQKGAFDVNVSINDETKETWRQKIKGNIEEEKYIKKTWKTENTTGRGTGAEVTLNRQLGVFRFSASLYSDAKMIHSIESSGADALPIPLSVFDVPKVDGFIESYVTLPFSGGNPDEKNASFEKTFSDLQVDYLGNGLPPETKAAKITVTYRFGNKVEG